MGQQISTIDDCAIAALEQSKSSVPCLNRAQSEKLLHSLETLKQLKPQHVHDKLPRLHGALALCMGRASAAPVVHNAAPVAQNERQDLAPAFIYLLYVPEGDHVVVRISSQTEGTLALRSVPVGKLEQWLACIAQDPVRNYFMTICGERLEELCGALREELDERTVASLQAQLGVSKK